MAIFADIFFDFGMILCIRKSDVAAIILVFETKIEPKSHKSEGLWFPVLHGLTFQIGSLKTESRTVFKRIAKETCMFVRSPRASLAPWCRKFVNLFPARLYVWKQWLGCQKTRSKTGVINVIASGSVWIVFFFQHFTFEDMQRAMGRLNGLLLVAAAIAHHSNALNGFR